ncbi:DUF1049 domain-containing protein [Kaistia algarum]|uniref:lipopolysaccharide assembly protein LapA domain-containing protein n=1 Tax=Kaistia algarum TaxID=2083279 RepID=UPI000CE82014|nr:LapA family protein [Kaistia algarum]MCX5513697.1 LapA family protein [Kaistia algarum]PPE79427.1 DUF1049 domain-containing protein [Kaistia algarum]
MRRLIAAIILIPLAIVVVALSVANRHPVILSLDPFNGEAPAVAMALPLYVVFFAALALGVLIGGVAVWLGQSHWRSQARRLKRETASVRRENEAFKAVRSSPATALAIPRRGAA